MHTVIVNHSSAMHITGVSEKENSYFERAYI